MNASARARLRRRQRAAEHEPEATLARVAAAISAHLTDPATGRPLVPYPEQIAGARALLRGAVAEMATGEGKTLTAAFAAAVWARLGSVHLATANAYLAERDAALLAPVYADLGLTTAALTPLLPAAERRRRYAADIIYAPLSEFGFDYLRDRLVVHVGDRVQTRGLGSLIVDEADLLLIDEARTPLIIAGSDDETNAADWRSWAAVVERLVAEQGERVRAKLDRLAATERGSFAAAVLTAHLLRGGPRDPAVLACLAANPALRRRAEAVTRELSGGHGWMLDDGLLYAVDERARTGTFTEEGQRRVEDALGPLFDRPEEHAATIASLHNLLLAHTLFQRDHDYLVRDDRVVLIEEETGRAAESRRYLRGLHTALEVKELGFPRADGETLAQISVQQFVRLYVRRAGMTGTAKPAAREFAHLYELDVAVIPRHRPNRRVDLPAHLYRTAEDADRAVVAAIATAQALGRPVLVGTGDVERSERLSRLLHEAGVSHALLNAREHAQEATIIAEAGRLGAVTIATNMAGRGTDIRLQPDLTERLVERAAGWLAAQAARAPAGVLVDCASAEAAERLVAALAHLGGVAVERHAGGKSLLVAGGDRHPSPLPDREREAGGARLIDEAQSEALLPAAQPANEPAIGAEPPDNHTARSLSSPIPRGRAPSPAPPSPSIGGGGRGLGAGSPTIIPFGLGLYVIAVGAGESRRIDDQLRGRSGRQGDPGVTRLYAALDEPLLRRFGRAHGRAVIPAGSIYVEGRAAERLIRAAQRRAEQEHAGQRRQLFRLDEVNEAQRRALLAAYERVLTHPDPASLAEPLLTAVVEAEWQQRPAAAAQQPAWWADLAGRFGVPAALPPPASAEALRGLLAERLERAAAESGDRWPGLVRSVLLRTAAELWTVHVESLEELTRAAPLQFAFLPAPVAVSFALEASRRYADYLIAVRTTALATLAALPQPYERPLPAGEVIRLSPAAADLRDWLATHANLS